MRRSLPAVAVRFALREVDRHGAAGAAGGVIMPALAFARSGAAPAFWLRGEALDALAFLQDLPPDALTFASSS